MESPAVAQHAHQPPSDSITTVVVSHEPPTTGGDSSPAIIAAATVTVATGYPPVASTATVPAATESTEGVDPPPPSPPSVEMAAELNPATDCPLADPPSSESVLPESIVPPAPQPKVITTIADIHEPPREIPPLMDTTPTESLEETLLARYFDRTPPTSLQPRPDVTNTDSSQESPSIRRTARSRKSGKPASQSDYKAAGVRTKTAPGFPPPPTTGKKGKVSKTTKTNTVAKETLAHAAQVFNRFSSLEALDQDDQ